jgi:hypothetical protein
MRKGPRRKRPGPIAEYVGVGRWTGYTRDRKMPTAAEREAKKAFRETEAKVAISEYARAQKAFHANRERLKAERWLGRHPPIARQAE